MAGAVIGMDRGVTRILSRGVEPVSSRRTWRGAAWRFGVTPAVDCELDAGTRWPSSDAYDRICEVFGWPQAHVWRSASWEGLTGWRGALTYIRAF